MTHNAPIARQRSEWRNIDGSQWARDVHKVIPSETVARCHMRQVHDGTLMAIVVEEPQGWHASISWQPNSARQAKRYPSWDELAHARYELLPHDVDFVMHLPPPSEYVAISDTCFHLHEHPERAS